MKKTTILSLLAAFSLTAGAQQLPNSGFEDTWVSCVPWTSTNNTKSIGNTPNAISSDGWHMSHTIGMNGTGKKEVGGSTTGNGSATAVNLTNAETGLGTLVKTVPAYLTLGTPWSTSSGMLSITKMDGGTFGGLAFAYKPDALAFDYKTSAGHAATAVAYLWKGTYKQSDVAGNIASSDKKLVKVEMTNRDRVILDKLTSSSQGGAVTAKGTLIASLDQSLSANTAWGTQIINFDYKTTDTPEMINVIFSAGDYWNSSPVKDYSLTVDNVKLIYRSQLTSLNYNGTAVSGFSKDTYSYTVEGDYTQGCLSYASNGHNATTSESYDATTRTATLVVSNVSTDENGQTSHTYTVNFAAPIELKLASLTFGVETQPAKTDDPYHVFRGDYTPGCLTVTPTDSKATANVDYDAETRIATVTLTDGKGNTSDPTYVKFAKANVDEYSGKMFIEVADLGGLLAAPTPGQNGEAPVEISKAESGKVDFQLNDFTFMGEVLGNIYVTDVPVTIADGITTLYKEQTVNIFGAAGAELGDLPVTLKARVEDGILTASIAIVWMGSVPINVNIYPSSAACIDLGETVLDDFDGTELRRGLTNPNCLIYASGTVDAETPNVVLDGICANLKIDADYDFAACRDFKVEGNATYKRALKKGWNTMALPLAGGNIYLPAGAICQKFTGVTGNKLNFEKDPTGAAGPYLVWVDKDYAAEEHGMSCTNMKVYAEVAPVEHEGISFCANFTTGFPMAGLYGVAPKQGTQSCAILPGGPNSTLGSTRAYFRLPAGTDASRLSFALEGFDDTTGIGAIAADGADGEAYDLSGRRVSRPARGLYIQGGRKVLVK